MTNAEKYKTAEERANAFKAFCDSQDEFCCSTKGECPLFDKYMDCHIKEGEYVCAFLWLELEAEEN